MAALNATGFIQDQASPNNHPLRREVVEEVLKRNPPSLVALKEFFEKHRRQSATLDLGQYISFAVFCSGPPGFTVQTKNPDLPLEVPGLTDLSPLLAKFYQEAGIDDLWKRSQHAIDQYILRYHAGVAETVLSANAYLRQQTSGVQNSRFQIFIELLAPPNQIHTLSGGYQYTVVVTPSPEPRIFDIRHAYLHYLLEPLAARYQETIDRKKPIADHAQRAPALDESYKTDFVRLTTESLIKAVEARLDRNPAAVQQALLDGYILAPYFAEGLDRFQQQEQAMVLYFPQLVGAIDLYKEEKRLVGVEFNREASTRMVKAAPAPPPPVLTGVAKTLDDAEQAYAARELDKAKALYLKVLEQSDQQPLHGAAYYGLARVAILSKDPETAERLFTKALEAGPEPPVKAWVLVYLGKLSLSAAQTAKTNRDDAAAQEFLGEARKHFETALKVDGASEKARDEARKSLEQIQH
jgi:tetratricopeptide (TPR) repeat protein